MATKKTFDQSPYREQSRPAWSGDPKTRMTVLPGGSILNQSAFAPTPQQTTFAGAVSAGDSEVTLTDAVDRYLVKGDRIFVSSTGEALILRQRAQAGDTTLAVHPVKNAIADLAAAVVIGTYVEPIKSGTVVGRTIAERDAGTGFSPADDAHDEFALVTYDVTNVYDEAGFEPYREGGLVYTNALPEYAGLSATVKAALASKYELSIKDEF